MIDIHCHILPGLDDGARTMDDAVAMARMAGDDGISTVVATPHHWEEMYAPTPQEIRRAVGAVQDRLADEGIALKLLPGQEVMMAADVPERLRGGDLVTLGDRGEYLLIEVPRGEIPPGTEQVILEIMSLGVRPIIAHPEKCGAIRRKPEVLRQLVQHGCLIQMDADSLGGSKLGPTARFASGLLKDGLVHILASDGHSPTDRPPVISPYLPRAGSIASPQILQDMTVGRPNLIVGAAKVTIRSGVGTA